MSIIYFATTKIDSESRICQCFSNSVRGMTNNNRVSLVKTSPLDTLSKHRGYALRMIPRVSIYCQYLFTVDSQCVKGKTMENERASQRAGDVRSNV